MAAHDEYETRFMSEGGILLHERHVSRVYAALMAIPALGALALAAGIVLSPDTPAVVGLVPLFAGGAVTAAGLFFAVMRTTVTWADVHVQYGLLGPRIPISAITGHEVEKLDTLTRLAFGPKLELGGGWSYVPPGVKGGVRVRWSEGGKARSCLIGATDPQALADAIARARAGRPRARVEVGENDEVAHELESPASKRARRS